MIAPMRCFALAVLLLTLVGCASDRDPGNPVLVRVGEVEIRVRDFQAKAADVARASRAQMAMAPTPEEQKMVLLDQMIKNEAVWQEVVRHGYDKRSGPREQIVDSFLQDRVQATNPSYELPDADIARYYADHIDSMGPPGARPSLAQAAPGIRALLKRTLIERKKNVLLREIAQKARGEIDFVVLKEVALPSGLFPQRPSG